ncbi:hypothetical protein RISK_001896 [Rhodopirellula islandica]|uniref:Uncharacterized protein n=1 Tax=Rhodopirellula islandica TaxID=595434 RepID=A0A0J1BHM8_RHOIS|nr:hypothetical protein RISK_001896 [Rhodopirellula islandica]
MDRQPLLHRTDRHDRIVSANRCRISRSISNSGGHLARIASLESLRDGSHQNTLIVLVSNRNSLDVATFAC